MELFIIKPDYKNLIGFLIIKELNQRQVKQVKILVKYYFEIKYIRGIDNVKVDILNRKAELQGSKKPLDVILCINKDKKIRYNHLKLVVVYKALIVN